MVFARGTLADYERFATLHYRRETPAFVSNVFLLKGIAGEDAGVITYSYPPANCAARNRLFTDLPRGRSERLKRINEQFRIVSRVILLPEYRGLGLASLFLRHSANFVDVRCIEALSASEAGAGLFERAGFTRTDCPESRQKKRLIRLMRKYELPFALSCEARRAKTPLLPAEAQEEIYRAAGALLGAYGRLREIKACGERLEAAVQKLHCNPAYFYLLKAGERRRRDA
jgi:GNAT superfamily N-acetyltransferase